MCSSSPPKLLLVVMLFMLWSPVVPMLFALASLMLMLRMLASTELANDVASAWTVQSPVTESCAPPCADGHSRHAVDLCETLDTVARLSARTRQQKESTQKNMMQSP
jgi:hypothetical protein